jgi:CRP/FNR family transcriptional regulator, dissimilatory nitrate respiration regulator
MKFVPSLKPTGSLSFAASRTLQTLPILQGVRERTLQEITRSATQLRMPKRMAVYQPSDECTGLYVIVEGEIKLVLGKLGNRERVVALLSRAQWFGETALILRERHTSGAKTADTPTTLLHLPKPVVLDCLNRDHAFALRFLATTCERFRSTLYEAERVGTTARRRVLGFLLEQVPPRIAAGPITISLNVPKRAVASRLNLSPEHLSRVLRELSDARMVDVDGPNVLICDVARLRKETRGELAR